jgi:mannose-6-phosphate isomerase-like protein (cupin superfamily)
MSGYTIVNLKEVEDQAPNFGLAPDFEARFARVALEAELIGLTYQRLAPNLQVPWGHTHKTQEEVFVVLSGSVRVKVGDEIMELGPWDAIRVSKETPRGFEAGPEGAELIAIGAPGGPGDAVNIENFWNQ